MVEAVINKVLDRREHTGQTRLESKLRVVEEEMEQREKGGEGP